MNWNFKKNKKININYLSKFNYLVIWKSYFKEKNYFRVYKSYLIFLKLK